MTWYYANEGKQFGPVSEAELAQLARGGIVRNEDRGSMPKRVTGTDTGSPASSR